MSGVEEGFCGVIMAILTSGMGWPISKVVVIQGKDGVWVVER